MFTGIIEAQGRLESLKKEGSNVHFTFSCPFTPELKIDQSLAHDGVCLTVTSVKGQAYTVTAIDETLRRTNLGQLKLGEFVNLERCMPANGRFDGHIVQGHVDTTAKCSMVTEFDGSWEFEFDYPEGPGHITVEKGSITVNGVSLTVVKSAARSFSVCIIPYTHKHTGFRNFRKGSIVNLEFDIVGKYVSKLLTGRG